MAKKAIVLLAGGFEEVEAITPIDYLRRAGIEVTVAAVGKGLSVRGAHGIDIKGDAAVEEAVGKAWDAVICPGGMPGSANLAASREVKALLTAQAAGGRLICAICAAPALVLAPLGLLEGKKFTCYPGMEKEVAGALHSPDKVVQDGNVITSMGAGTAGLFAVSVISALLGEEAGKRIASGVLL